MKLSLRLQTIADLIGTTNSVLDIGTDHGWLPIYLLENKLVKHAILADVNQGPLDNAKTNLVNSNLQEQASLILANGFDGINEDFDVAVIAGMGGFTIAEILANAPTLNKKYILQPNNGEYHLRNKLAELSLKIDQELIIKDENKIYEILVVSPGEEQLTQQQLMFGKYLITEQNDVFKEKWNFELDYLSKILPKIKNLDEKKKVEDKIKTIKEVLC